jgi:hypothetical protein
MLIKSLHSVSGLALQSLVKSIEALLDPSLTTMIRRPWSSIDAVGDQSEYITQIAMTLSEAVQVVKKHLTSLRFFKTFCDKFAE